MKVQHIFLISAGLTFSVLSCASNDVYTVQEEQTAPETEVIETVVKTPDELYAEALKTDLTLSLVSAPDTVSSGKTFAKPYIFDVKHADGSACPDFEIEISYPKAKTQGVIEFATEKVKTDANGQYSFMPATPEFAADSYVSARPAVLYDTEEVKAAAKALEVSASYKVRSDVSSKGAILFVWDYNEKNRPVNNSYDIQSEFRKRGLTNVGNAPISDSSYIGKPLNSLYRANYEIIDDSFGYQYYGYLICGNIKFVKPVEADGDEYLCSLTADITGIKMKDGSVIFARTFSHEARGKNWTACTTKCKEELAKMIVDALVFGL
ncbi:MAG: hypothetical protein IJ688_04910 [Treponema sp.]|nr:hypothetical protein [Treponema sp.]